MMVFNLVVRRLHFLAKVPLAPQFFDAALLTWTALFHRERLGAIEQFEQTLSRLNIDRCLHRFGGTGFVLNGREFAHLHGNGLLDIEFTREVASQLIVENRAVPHHVLGPSRWVSLWLKSSADIPQALALIELACEIKKADQSAGLFEPA
jgi:hypothetical protein